MSDLSPTRRSPGWFRFDPRFGLRTMLIAVAIVAVGVCWWKDRQALESRVAKMEAELAVIRKASAASWSVDQLTGPPDVAAPGDNVRAWASTTQDGQEEWLLLEYERAVKATAVVVHETYCPGAVFKVAVFDANGREVVAWQGNDPTPPTATAGVSTIPLNVNFRVSRVKVYLDSVKVAGWNEIDAVGLVDNSGKTHWAMGADASSSYGAQIGPPYSGIQFTY